MDRTSRYEIGDLRQLMRRLRDPRDGCPWDLEQTHASLLRHTLEEVYELADAVEREDTGQLRDELGDYLFQAVFYAQIASERGEFDFDDVTHAIVEKLLKRHPHVFPDGTLGSRRDPGEKPDQEQIRRFWEGSKQSERSDRELHAVLDDVPLALPALQRAEKLQKRAATVGFDWDDRNGVLAKLDEEVAELRQALAGGDPRQAVAELGDLLFSCVNMARHLGVDAESALRAANRKFERRFRALEAVLARRGLQPRDVDASMLDEVWEQVKRETGTAEDGSQPAGG